MGTEIALMRLFPHFTGASIGPLIKLTIDFDPSIVHGAFVGCAVAFGCFSAAAMDIIEKAHFGDLDYVKHALTFFNDFAAVFVIILIIMLKNAGEKEEKKKKKRN
ncbi:Bax inhibitor 1 [Abeliophyllum distichum]|uniref:Bax inhibitor 1 n=1 Tax=Abeliophyllum distichum TaxID=126358 RepID=A0ABD1VBC0_9LAMI